MTELDCLVIGAGPAGCCAALRLLQLGYRVGLVERESTPRARSGESLTPGIRNILTLLEADDATAGLPHLAGRPALLRWEQDTLLPVEHADNAIVERAAFDARLLALATSRGALLWQPAQVQAIDGQADDWRIQLLQAGTDAVEQVSARWLFEATGRHGSTGTRSACSPNLAALWAEFDATQLDHASRFATRVEALPDAWIWAAPLPSGRLRVVVCADPHSLRGSMAAFWRRQLAQTHSLQALTDLAPVLPLQACAAGAYLDRAAWREGRVKIGDAAFAIDPISGSGVEKAMRFSLQAAVAWHSWRSATDAAGRGLARHYLIQQLNQTCARHAVWCADRYAHAWSAAGDFWRARSAPPSGHTTGQAPAARLPDDFLNALADAQAANVRPPPAPQAAQPLTASAHVRLDEACELTPHLCVVDDRVCMAPAVKHPRLSQPVAFVANQALAPHWALLRRRQTLGQLQGSLAQAMPPDAASAVVAWLQRSGVLA